MDGLLPVAFCQTLTLMKSGEVIETTRYKFNKVHIMYETRKFQIFGHIAWKILKGFDLLFFHYAF